MDARELALEIAKIADEKNGTDIVILDLRGISDVADFFVIATGANNRLVDALVDEVENQLRPKGVSAFAIEGRQDNTWALMDFGAVIAHFFQPDTRALYRLERLWGDAGRIELTAEGEFIETPRSDSDRVRNIDLIKEDFDEITQAANELIVDEE
ncbi:MAG: ribosome silencing factor [Coriobacteriales bacterium]|nr:ribosome silencing factor [Coriobacteriales bacterium]